MGWNVGLNTDIPTTLDIFMADMGLTAKEDLPAKPDIVWPQKKESRFDYKAWKPSYDGEQPPF